MTDQLRNSLEGIFSDYQNQCEEAMDSSSPRATGVDLAGAVNEALALFATALEAERAEKWNEGAHAQAAAYGMDKDTGPNPYEKGDVR